MEVLTTYSAKGEIKRILIENGFNVTLLAGPSRKKGNDKGYKEMIIYVSFNLLTFSNVLS